MDEVLRQALEPVLGDLRRTGLREPTIEDRDWTGDHGQPSAMLLSPDESKWGVSVPRSAPAVERIAVVADQVQEWAIEEQWSAGAATNWPPCPRHPGTHPLSATTVQHAASWVCPADGAVVARIGEL